MPLDPASAHWHRLFGGITEALDRPNFWNVLIRYLGDCVAFDNWVVLRFSRHGRPTVLAESEASGGGVDELFINYLGGFYLLDPFYIACMDEARAGLFRLDDVAPDHFEAEDYYQRYFKLNIVADEVQFNLPVDADHMLILSLGSRHRYDPATFALLDQIAPWLLALMRQRQRIEQSLESHGAQESAESHAGDNGEAAPGLAASPPAAEGAPARPQNSQGLTAREWEIMQLLLSGHSSKGISQKLAISPETVKAHRRHIYSKLGVRSHPELLTIYLKSHAER
jgi:DNA-binding CsgD family transcriptional regulator